MKFGKKILSVGLSLTLCASLVVPALAAEYNIQYGDVVVTKDGHSGYIGENQKKEYKWADDKEVIVTGTSTDHTITVGENVTDATITLKDVNIDVSATGEEDKHGSVVEEGKAAMSIGANSSVTVELDGDNTLKSGQARAGLELNDKDSNGNKVTGEGVQGGSVTITDANKTDGSLDATGGSFSAGIGSGVGGTVNSITISGGNVTAKSENMGAGVGAGEDGKVGNITISGGNVKAAGGYYGAGIGAGSVGKVGSINISGGNVEATCKSGGVGIGAGTGRQCCDVGSINISGGTVKATGGLYGAGIGSGENSGTVGSINISGGTVEAVGGYQGAGIGSGYEHDSTNSTVEAINISGGKVTATGGTSAAAIGGGHLGSFGVIDISGGEITAVSGNRASAIGHGRWYVGELGTIIINGADSLIALGDRTAEYKTDRILFAIDTRCNVEGVTQTILNGQFLDEIGKGSGGSTTMEDTQFVIVDAQGKIVKEFTLNVQNKNNMYDSFAVALPAGTYYVFPKSAYDGLACGYGQDGKQVAYVIGSNGMLTADNMQFTDAEVSYRFEAGGEGGNELPNAVTSKLPESGGKLTQSALSAASYEDVVTEGGTWHFEGWTGSEVGEDGNLELVGTWTFTKNNPAPVTPVPPVTPGGGFDYDFGGLTTIDDEAVPLASGPVTRAEFLDYLWRHEGEPASDGVCTFTDVAADHEFILALAWAEQNGLAEAYEDGTFQPDELVTVAAVRDILDNFADVFGTNVVAADDLTTLTGEEDEAVLNCDEVLAEFFGEEYTPAEVEDDIAA